MLHAATPLPVRAGDTLGWGFDVVHWGGQAGPGAHERRSVSLEFIAATATPTAAEQPLFDVGEWPSFQERIRTIARA